MGTGGPTEHAGGADAENVIQFPRDWFGSKDDLVPFGPAADRLEKEAADARVAGAGELSSALNANDFWGGDSGSLHQPVDVRPDEDPVAFTELEDAPLVDAISPLMHVVPDDDYQPEVEAAEPARLSVSPARPQYPPGIMSPTRLAVPSRRMMVGVAGAVTIVALLLVMSGVIPGGGSGHHARSADAALAAVRQAPGTPTPTGATTRLSSSDVALAVQAKATAQEKAHEKAAAKLRRQRRAKASQSKTVKHTSATHHTTSTPTVDTTPVVSTDDVTDESTSAAASSDSSPVVSSTPAASSGSTAGAGSTASASGPSGLGTAVGPTCNPSCSAQ